ncbi:WXG100 family type VII secretion target [Demequina aurantiaca]|uniref:WXG100 family type VII secretion target n=1 Tax=Demequina aurantiaca TaxID=676200 RepID=UPI003D33771E
MAIPPGSGERTSVPTRRIAASSPAMRSAAQALFVANRAIEEHLSTLEREVSDLKVSWDGDARAAYAVAQQQWTANLAEMNAVLGRVSSRVSAVDESYRATSRNIGRAT